MDVWCTLKKRKVLIIDCVSVKLLHKYIFDNKYKFLTIKKPVVETVTEVVKDTCICNHIGFIIIAFISFLY